MYVIKTFIFMKLFMPTFSFDISENQITYNESYIWNTLYHANIEFHQRQIFSAATQGDNYVDEILGEEFDAYVIHPWSWKRPELEVPWFVFVLPLFALIVLTTNTTVIIVFVKENLLSSMNYLLIGIAISDTLTVVLPTPLLVYLYAINDIPEVPFHLCRMWDYMTKYAPVMTHSASVFLTLCLAVHRYLCVCFPFYARRVCSRRKSVVAIILSYVLAITIHCCRFFDTTYIPITVKHSVRNETIATCRVTHSDWLKGKELTYECVYYWVYIITVKLIPCFSLIVFDTMMLRQMRRADGHRLTISKETGNENRINFSRRITWMIICIVGIVCLVEIPLAIVLIIWTISIMHLQIHISEEFLAKASIFLNLLIYTSYPIIFLFYCFMSKRFKNAVKNLFKC